MGNWDQEGCQGLQDCLGLQGRMETRCSGQLNGLQRLFLLIFGLGDSCVCNYLNRERQEYQDRRVAKETKEKL